MQWGTVAGLVIAFFGMVTVIGGTWVTFRVFLPSYKKTLETSKQTIEIHQIVNQQRTDMRQYTEVLKRLLQAHDIEVPDDQSQINTTGGN